MNSALMFSKASDEWATPRDFFEGLAREFDLCVDAAATRENAKFPDYFGPDNARHPDALTEKWSQFGSLSRLWLNPPYSRCREFIAKAALEASHGCTVVALVPARVDTKWFHEFVWDAETHQPRAGVEVRFVKGRLKFGDGKNSAPFPSVVIIFRPTTEAT